MTPHKDRKTLLDETIRTIMESWYARCMPNYVTVEESQQLGVEPELKYFSDDAGYRIKFSRANDLDVTYGLSLLEEQEQPVIVSSVNNKTAGFDLDSFIDRLKSYYWRTRNEKPWTLSGFDRYTYDDVMPFEPHLGQTVFLEARRGKADIVRLHFRLDPNREDQLLQQPEVLRDLIENYCLSPLRRIYAEAYRREP